MHSRREREHKKGSKQRAQEKPLRNGRGTPSVDNKAAGEFPSGNSPEVASYKARNHNVITKSSQMLGNTEKQRRIQKKQGKKQKQALDKLLLEMRDRATTLRGLAAIQAVRN